MEMVRDHRGSGGHAHLCENAAGMSANRPRTDFQYVGDCFIRKSSGDQADDFPFPRTERELGLAGREFVTKNHKPRTIDLGFGDDVLGRAADLDGKGA